MSTALKSLGDVGRVPAPGSRREHHRCPDDAWARLMSTQNTTVQAMLHATERGIAARRRRAMPAAVATATQMALLLVYWELMARYHDRTGGVR